MGRKGCLRKPLFAWMIWMVEIDSQQFFQRQVSLHKSVVAWIEAEMEFALSQAVASGDAFEHGTSERGHCVQDFLADLDLRDLPGESAGFEFEVDDSVPTGLSKL